MRQLTGSLSSLSVIIVIVIITALAFIVFPILYRERFDGRAGNRRRRRDIESFDALKLDDGLSRLLHRSDIEVERNHPVEH